MSETYRGFDLSTRILEPENGNVPTQPARSVARRGRIEIELPVTLNDEHERTRAEIDALLDPPEN
jgi:hypothetical protein